MRLRISNKILFVPFAALFFFIFSFSLGFFLYKGALPYLNTDPGAEGFHSQIANVTDLISNEIFLDEFWQLPLLLVHFFRYLSVLPFLELEKIFGPLASLFAILCLLFPLVSYDKYFKIPWIASVIFLLPLFVSFRTALVAIGVGYIFLYILKLRESSFYLWVGVLFSNLSSASVVIAFLLIIFIFKAKKNGISTEFIAKSIALICLSISFVFSFLDKLQGFSEGAVGYQAQLETDNIFLAVISRNNLWMSLMTENYSRAFFYIGVFFVFSVVILKYLLGKKNIEIRKIIWCCIPGVFVEGLGVWAMLFPLVWIVFAGRKILCKTVLITR